METRRDGAVFGLGGKIVAEDANITGTRLPTKEQVIRCFKYHQDLACNHNYTKAAIAKIVLGKLEPFYEKGHIPMIAPKSASDKIIKLVSTNAKLREIPKLRRSSGAGKDRERIDKELEDLKTTFVLWPKNVEQLITNEEDKAFLQSMMSDRVASFGCKDNILKKKTEKIREEAKLSEVRARKSTEEVDKLFHTVQFGSSTDEDQEDTDTDVELHPSSTSDTGNRTNDIVNISRHRRSRTGTTIHVPPNILSSPRLVSLATRLGMTPADQAPFTETLVAECSGDVKKISTSYSRADRARRFVNKEIVKDIKEHWIPPSKASIHWDGKIMKPLERQYRKGTERLAIALGDSTDIKLLGTPFYHTGDARGAGEIVSTMVMEQLQSWGCVNNVINILCLILPRPIRAIKVQLA